jgi:non-specific serine/threonine protein kinase
LSEFGFSLEPVREEQKGMQRASASYTFGRFHLDAAERRLSRDGQPIPLTPKAFDTLLTLVQHSGHALSKDELMRAVWPDGFVEEINLASNISIVRKALADGQSGERYIETIPKLGYRFVAPVQTSPSPLGEGRGGVRTNLPAALTRFIGRENEIAQVQHALGANRLVTLTGSGGVGKTRLALEVAQKMSDFSKKSDIFEGGIWLVELAPLSDPALAPRSVVTTLGLIEGSGRPIIDILTDFLRSKKALLVLDNCEHLIEACAQLADTLLRACPDLTILATSREPLGIAGEAVYRLPSLTFPDPHPLPPVEEMIAFDAVRLFVERAGATGSGFVMTEHNASAVAEVCRRLDGIPLAIELASARASVMPVEQIAARLDDRFGLLTGGSRAALPRHKTLRALIDWSFDLLTTEERDLLARLSVFADGFTAEAAEAVADQPSALDLLARLVDKSLSVADVCGEVARYRLLETIRQYAHDKLLSCGELERTRDRLLNYFLCLAERAEPELRRADQIRWLDRLEGELDNLRAALGWALDSDRHVEAGLRLATALLWFWHARDHKREGSDWLQRALAAEERTRGAVPLSPSRVLTRARALNAASLLMGMHRRLAEFKALAEEALMLARGLGEPGKHSVAFALCHLAAEGRSSARTFGGKPRFVSGDWRSIWHGPVLRRFGERHSDHRRL